MYANITDLLRSDHESLIKLMMEMENKIIIREENETLDTLFQSFRKMFTEHDNIEEKVFYPALKNFEETYQLILKASQAHHMVNVGIMELRLLPYTSENWGPKFLVIKDSILSHISEEELKLFKKAEELIDNTQLEELGKKAMELKS